MKRAGHSHKKHTAYGKPLYFFVLLILLLSVATGAFYRVVLNDFVSYDDHKYVLKNPHLRDGITIDTIRWAFTSCKRASNWHPLTWLSHALDWQLFGAKPAGHHMVNLLFHLANITLLFLFLYRATGAMGRSAVVAGLFGVHPLHVESVAWVAERKDVLSTFFWMLTMWAYVLYVRLGTHEARRKVWAYSGMVFFFTLGLLCKPMVVTLPCVLLLLDYWPLGRVGKQGAVSGIPDAGSGVWRREESANWKALVVEKAPLFLLVAGSSVMTFYAQRAGGSVASMEGYTVGVRIANAFVSYVAYLWKMIWPRCLAPFYPHPNDTIPTILVFMSTFLVLGVSVLSILYRRRMPYFFVGWFWYLGTLVPVIGFIQVGMQAMADRYTYVPLTGVFIALVWGIGDAVNVGRGHLSQASSFGSKAIAVSPFLPVVSAIALVALACCSWVQVGYWKDTVTLFEHALAVTRGNYVAHNNIGQEMQAAGRLEEAIAHYSRAVQTDPDPGLAYNNLGAALAQSGKVTEAMKMFEEALKCDPDCAEAYVNLGRGLALQGKVDEALKKLKQAIEIDPDQAGAYLEIGNILGRKGFLDKAAEQFRIAIRIDPGMPEAHSNLGFVLRQQGRIDEAIPEFEEAIRLRPSFAAPYHNLLAICYKQHDYDGARQIVARAAQNGAVLDPRMLKPLSDRTRQ